MAEIFQFTSINNRLYIFNVANSPTYFPFHGKKYEMSITIIFDGGCESYPILLKKIIWLPNSHNQFPYDVMVAANKYIDNLVFA